RGRLADEEDERFDEKAALLRAEDGVASATGVHRGTIEAATGARMQLLALDPVVATDALWWRDDFATRSVDAVMRELQSVVPPGGGYVLPEDATTLRLW